MFQDPRLEAGLLQLSVAAGGGVGWGGLPLIGQGAGSAADRSLPALPAASCLTAVLASPRFQSCSFFSDLPPAPSTVLGPEKRQAE